MKAKVERRTSTHGPRHRTAAGRSVLRDLFAAEEAVELEIRAILLQGLEAWLANGNLTQVRAAEALGVTQARISDIRRGKINAFSLALLIRLAARAGLQPTLRLAA